MIFFIDSANLKEIQTANNLGIINGVTTNPTLMRKAGIKDYKKFAIELLSYIKNKPI